MEQKADYGQGSPADFAAIEAGRPRAGGLAG